MVKLMDAAAAFFEDVANKEKEKHNKHHTSSGHSGSGDKRHHKEGEKKHQGIRNNVTSPLHLAIINTPQLRKMAEALFTACIGDDEDEDRKPHAAFAKYLLELDQLLRKYGAKPGQGSSIGESSPGEENETSDKVGDDDQWKT